MILDEIIDYVPKSYCLISEWIAPRHDPKLRFMMYQIDAFSAAIIFLKIVFSSSPSDWGLLIYSVPDKKLSSLTLSPGLNPPKSPRWTAFPPALSILTFGGARFSLVFWIFYLWDIRYISAFYFSIREAFPLYWAEALPFRNITGTADIPILLLSRFGGCQRIVRHWNATPNIP